MMYALTAWRLSKRTPQLLPQKGAEGNFDYVTIVHVLESIRTKTHVG